jgi:tRNA uridine 5-carboxymethylaminomethyl modification enzyme
MQTKSVAEFENVKFLHFRYAIAFIFSIIKHTLETKLLEGLYFAGQINEFGRILHDGLSGTGGGIQCAFNLRAETIGVLVTT